MSSTANLQTSEQMESLAISSGRRQSPLQRYGKYLDGVLQRLPEPEQAQGVSLGVTSITSRRGTTTVATSIAFHALKCGLEPIAIVDAATRPKLSEMVGGASGLANGIDRLRNGEDLEACAVRTKYGLDVVTAAHESSQPWNAIDAQAVMDVLHSHYQLIIFDLPPVDEMSVVAPLVRRLSGVCLVVCAEQDDREKVVEAYDALRGTGANMLGAILNKERNWFPFSRKKG